MVQAIFTISDMGLETISVLSPLSPVKICKEYLSRVVNHADAIYWYRQGQNEPENGRQSHCHPDTREICLTCHQCPSPPDTIPH